MTDRTTEQRAMLQIIRLIAADIGRLRRITPEETSAWWALDRIANNVETLDNILQPSAAELYHEYTLTAGDFEGIAIREALRITDQRVASLHELLNAAPRQTLRAVA